MLIDNHGRAISYLRLAVTDRCNLRCRYCMPAGGAPFLPRRELLSWSEMLRLLRVLGDHGVDKVRITGGEPFARPGLIDFLGRAAALPTAPRLSITTNATLLAPHIGRLKALGIRRVNVSLDALDPGRFLAITRRDAFATVYANLLALVAADFEVKVNCIVLDGQNTDQILPFVALTRELPVAVRFLEEMPFNGSTERASPTLAWDYRRILRLVHGVYPSSRPVGEVEPGSTSQNYRIPGHAGTYGVIASYSRTFCGTCNRIRVSANGELRTCLYGDNVASFAPALRAADPAREVERVLAQALGTRHADGFAAERAHGAYTSMTSIGG